MEKEESKFNGQIWISALTTQNYLFQTSARFLATEEV